MSPRAHCICIPYVRFKHYVLKRTYGVHNVRNVCVPDAMGDVIFGIGIGIGIGIAVSNSIGCRVSDACMVSI